MDAIGRGEADKAKITSKERVLLDYVKVLTLEPAEVRDGHVEALRKAGWTDEEVFEASYITALFAFFNRMADAYGLDYPANGWMPEELRSSPAGREAAQTIPKALETKREGVSKP